MCNEDHVEPLIRMSNISKAFDSNVALDDVSLELASGSVHALVGENGAGKSTLMKILAGVVQPDGGSIHRNCKAVHMRTPKEALECVSTVFQELSLLPNLSIAENMYLGKEPVTKFGRVDYATMESLTANAITELGLDLDPTTLVSELSIAERQFVEIAHGITADADVVILDEPTAALNAADVETLNRHIRSLRDRGKAIVYISHRMEEIFEICDTVSVLKDGRNVDSCPLSEVTQQSLIAMMVGRDINDLFPNKSVGTGESVLTIKDFQVSPGADPLELSVHKGEIVGLAGLEGQGQRELLRSLVGQHQPHAGSVTINSTSLPIPVPQTGGIRLLQSMGVGFVPEDRKDEGLFLELPIGFNTSIGLHSSKSELSWAQGHHKTVAETMSSMAVKAPSADSLVSSLSGGNQQKVLLGRYLASEVEILLIEEPTRGVDVGAKAEIYQLLRDFTDSGGAIIVLSRETIELIGLCDRLCVVHDNTIVSEMPAAEATEHKILDAALGAQTTAA